ncbi:hypothetical protein TSAR_012544 [Trichomalopsis sarcophagae]|uniref:Adipokinetic hormone n=1 Tax=Trichomalopsis sarcophagae TaxID=543379 RepID=A0A232FFQ1_9HYME|nr:hypothetical protein TSAR_012544 [Trichomalopsis sarcophagae]
MSHLWTATLLSTIEFSSKIWRPRHENCRSLLALGLCLCVVLLQTRAAEAQLNFSTGWGKRSSHLLQPAAAASSGIGRPRQPADFDYFLQRYYRRLRKSSEWL